MDRRTFLYAAIICGGFWAFAGPRTTEAVDRLQTLAKGQLPEFADARFPEIHRLYGWAVAHGDELQYIPCFCGCGRFGHKSNRDCYVKAFNADGTITFTSHAAT